MAIVADANGVVQGTFTIPAGVPAGAKTVAFTGRGGSRATTSFVGSGNLTVQTMQQVTTVVSYFTDPVAETFVLDAETQLAGVDLWFTANGGTGATVQIRETANSYPSRVVLAEQRIAPDALKADGTHTRVQFAMPVTLQGGTEYAIVVLCDDAETAVAVAELGKFDAYKQTPVTAQPYTVGVLFTSSNGATWTAHHTMDLTFRLLAADYTQTARTVNLGVAPVDGATDIMLFSLAETPTAATRVEYSVTLPSGAVVTADDGQPIRLPEAATGTVQVAASIKGSRTASPVVWPGAQLVAGAVQQQADYVSRAVPAFGATKAVLVYDALLPSGAAVAPSLRKNQGTYAPMQTPTTTHMDDGWVEFRWEQAVAGADTVQVKLDLSGTVANRPMVRNIRILAV